MPSSNREKSGLPGHNEPAATGKEKAKVPAHAQAVDPARLASSRKEPRRVKIREDVDPDYAEEAEDFFYGEGM